MGFGKKRIFRRDFNKSREDSWKDKKPKTNFIEKEDLNNAAFEEYYRAQGTVPDSEFELFLSCLRKPLPTTFRINGSGQYANDLRDKMLADFFQQIVQGDIVVDGEKVEPPRPLPWYPNNYAWQLNFSRNQLRKLPILEAFHEFMKKANDAGTITRQEAVSMVPPLFLDVQPNHRVLDMCAAPGSKTFQLLEALHAGDQIPVGFVVANDVDAQRCNLLTHQTKRMCSPCLVVTNHEAQNFPLVTPHTPEGEPGETLFFDRILCDVPCSGDGTLRKAPDIWRRWNVNNGNGLHVVQLKISLHACRLLKVGGRLVYSTCSFNPVENEAVVAELLRRTKGAMRLLDVGDQLPNLQRSPGLRSWKIRDRFRFYSSWEEAKEVGFKLDATMFPVAGEDLPLERCMRFLPYHQDTGGFFVAVLEKVADMPADLALPSVRHRWMQSETVGGEAAAADKLQAALEGLKAVAEKACAAAEQALDALDASNEAAAHTAVRTTQAAVARSEMTLRDLPRASQSASEAAAVDGDPTGGVAVAAAAADEGEAEGEGDAVAVDGDEDMAPVKGEEEGAGPEGEVAAEAEEDLVVEGGEPEGEGPEAVMEDTEGTAAAAAGPSDPAAAGPSAPAVNPSWVRGGGGRNRGAAAGGGRYRGIDPVVPLEDSAIISNMIDFYGISDAFPMRAQLISRTLEVAKPKRLYFITSAIKAMLVADEREALKITSVGLKIFERQDVKEGYGPCSYRIAQEGLPLLLPFLSKQLVSMSAQDIMRLVVERSVPTPLEPVDGQTETLKTPKTPFSDPALLAQLRDIHLGCCVCTLRPEEAMALGLGSSSGGAAGSLTANAPIAICVWRSRSSLAVLVDKAECSQIASKLGSALKRIQTN